MAVYCVYTKRNLKLLKKNREFTKNILILVAEVTAMINFIILLKLAYINSNYYDADGIIIRAKFFEYRVFDGK